MNAIADAAQALAVDVPAYMRPLFERAQQRVAEYCAHSERAVELGILRLGGNRHLLLRGDALSSEFHRTIRSIYGDGSPATDVANALLFDLSHAVGAADAAKFIDLMGLVDPLEKLAVGPIYFAHAGFARVVVHPGSHPSPDDDYVLYYRHENSVESESWRRSGERAEHPVCILSTGYSSGWCSVAFGVPLVAVEYACEAAGDPGCEFVMAPPHRIEQHLARLPNIGHRLYVPRFFGRREHEERMQTLAYRDALTNLSNRTFFMEMGHQLLRLTDRRNRPAGVLFIDLDGFKAINDAYGHAAGDQVLLEVARRLVARVRESDLVARMGGDEFAVLLSEVTSPETVGGFAQELVELIGEPIPVPGGSCRIGASIGGVIRTGQQTSLEQLVAVADAAMYDAKRAGKNCCRMRAIPPDRQPQSA